LAAVPHGTEITETATGNRRVFRWEINGEQKEVSVSGSAKVEIRRSPEIPERYRDPSRSGVSIVALPNEEIQEVTILTREIASVVDP
jgi:hypothetical protein